MSNNNNTPPPWSEAPPWAMYRAQDEDGYWCFYKDEPCISEGTGMWSNREILFDDSDFFMSIRGKANPNWKTTLQKRPENE